MRSTAWAGVAVLVALLWASAASAQTGTIRGTVDDPSGAAVPKAKVTVTLKGTATARSKLSDSAGNFVFPDLPVGAYQFEVEAAGFKKFVIGAIDVTIGHVAVANARLQLGSVTQTVEVAAAATVVETTSTQLGAVMNDTAVSQLPLNTRDTYQLLQLQPGVTSQLGASATLLYGSDFPGSVSVNGGRGRANNFMVNGGNANDLFVNLPTVQPSPDAIQEFRVLSNTYDAKYGRNSGSVVNVVTKSGTNAFHGDVYEFFRNKVLDARGILNRERPDLKQNQFGFTLGGPIRKDRTFIFGSYEGRRIRRGIPSDIVTVPTKAERNGDFSADDGFAGTLTDDNFAQVLNGRPGCSSAISAAGGSMPAAGVPYSSIFPNNQIPTQCFDPVAVDLLKQFVPLPNIPGPKPLFQGIPAERDRGDQFTIRFDHKLTAAQQFSAYYYFDDLDQAVPFATFQLAGADLPGFGALNGFRFQQVSLSHTWTIGPTMINQVRFVYMREGQLDFNHPANTHSVQDSCVTVPSNQCFSSPDNPSLGITPGLRADRTGVPFITVGGGFSIGNNFEGELPQTGNSFEEADDFTKIIGNHTLGFGGDVQRNQFNQFLFFSVSGEYFYFGGGENDLATSNLFGNYLLGLPDEFGQGSAQLEKSRNTIVGLYAQDSWKMTPTLTLNYGLRWDLDTPFYDVNNFVQTFRPGQADTVFPCVIGPDGSALTGFPVGTSCAPGGLADSVFPLGLVVPGDKGIPPSLTQTYFKSFAPRIGLAWSPGWKEGFLAKLTGGPGKSSIRIGYGIFYNPIEQLQLEQFSAEPPFGGSTFPFEPLFSTPFELQDGTVLPNPFNGVIRPAPGMPVDFSVFRPILLFGQNQPNIRTQYAEQYNLTIQRELPSHILFQIGYVGTQGHRLLASHDLNPGNAQTCLDLQNISDLTGDADLACGPFFADGAFNIAANEIPSGVTLHLPYGSVASVTGPNPNPITLVGLRPFSSPLCQPTTGDGCPPDGVPVFSSIFAQDTIANSNYNALEVLVEKRLAKGLQFQAAYTYSHSIDNASSFEEILNPLDFRRSRSDSLFDTRHRFVFSYYWELPVPKHQGFAGKLLNGWGSSGILTLQHGFPIRITDANDLELQSSFDFQPVGQPNFSSNSFHAQDPRQGGCAIGTGPTAGPNASSPPTPCDPVPNLAFDPNQFTEATVAPGTIGNVPRTVCCGPGLVNADFTIIKHTAISERLGTEFRAEFFNAFNHANFFNPDGEFSDGADFGRVKSAHPPREIQFALKFLF